MSINDRMCLSKNIVKFESLFYNSICSYKNMFVTTNKVGGLNMVNDNLVEKVIEMMGENSQLCFIKGQLRNPEMRVKENEDVYYLADIRVPKLMNDTVYGVSFDIYHVCFGSDFVKENNITKEFITSLKDNEVFVDLIPSVKVNQKKQDGRVDKFNSSNYFVNYIKQLNKISKPEKSTRKVINL